MEPQRHPFPNDFTMHIGRIIDPVVDGDQITDKNYVDAAIASAMTGLHWQEAVLDRYDPTGGLPADVAGNRYISTATANGWTIDYIYEGTGGSGFVETIPTEGYCLTVEDEDAVYYYNDASNWVKFGNIIDHANLSNVTADQHHTEIHTFPSHSDTPANYTSAGNKFLKVNNGATAVEFSDNLIYDGDMKITLGDNAGANKLLVKDSDGTDVFTVDSDGLVSIIDVGTSEFGTIKRTGTDLEIDSGTGGDLKLIAAGSQALWINPGYSVFTTGLMYLYDATTTYGALFETNATHTIWRAFTSGLDMKIMWGDKDALLINNDASGGIFPDVVLASSSAMIPAADSCCTLGLPTRYFDTLYVDILELGDDELIQAKESLGVARALNLNIPIGAGGAAAAALDMQMQLDGTMEAGLLAETDGTAGYREPVFKIPAYSADYGVAWASPPNPTPASLVAGGMFVAHNTNDDTYRIFAYLNSGWRSVEAASHTLLHAALHQNGGSDEISVAGLSGQLADDQPALAHDLGGAKHNADTLANLNTKISDATVLDTGDIQYKTGSLHAAADHENGGGLEISVAGLSGQLADDQPALAHDLGGAKHNADTKANFLTKLSDVTEMYTNNASEISATPAKTVPVDGDMVLIEDSAAANAKKMSTLRQIIDNIQSADLFMLNCSQGSDLAGNQTIYCGPHGEFTVEAESQIRMPKSNVSRLTIYTDANTLNTNSTLQIRKNGVNQGTAITINSVTSGRLTQTQDIDFADGDLLSVILTLGGTVGQRLDVRELIVSAKAVA